MKKTNIIDLIKCNKLNMTIYGIRLTDSFEQSGKTIYKSVDIMNV